MPLIGCGVTPNAQRNFTVDTRLIMDVTIGHVFDTPIVANSLGQFGAGTLQFLWNLAYNQAKNTFGFITLPTNTTSQSSPPFIQQEND